MEPKDEHPKTFRFDDPRQQRIYRRLLLVGPGPASFYRDACQLIAGKLLLDSTTHLVAHLVREIEGALRDVLEPLADRAARLGEKDFSKPKDETHSAEIRAVLKALEIPETEPVAQAWLQLTGKENTYGLAARAHRDALARPRPLDEEFRQFWTSMEGILDIILERFESRYLESHHLLDELLSRTSPTREDAKRLRLHVPNNLVAFGYFFDRITSPAWLEPLRAEGFFKHPPEPDPDHAKGTVGFPQWPESRYLARMASLAPEATLKIILEMPDTENVRVHEDLADAALAMPAELAAKLVPKAKTWIESPYQMVLPEKLGALVTYLARGGQMEVALELARVLLAVLPDPRVEEETGPEQAQRLLPLPRARFDLYEYEQILKTNVPDLVATSGDRGLTLLCDLLDEAICLSHRRTEKEEPEESEDFSYIWRRAIEDHPQNQPHGPRELLVSAVRDAAEQLARGDPSMVSALVHILENRPRPWRVLQRIALHLLRIFPQAASELISQHLTDRTLFDTLGLRYEYTRLLKDQFGRLSPEDQTRILSWIEEGPDLEDVKLAQERLTGRALTEDDAILYAKRWRRDWFARFGSALPAEWRNRYEELLAELGPIDHPDFPSYITSWVGPTSPKSTGDLHSMSVEDTVAFLKTWQPSSDRLSPSPEGLGRILAAEVASSPQRFAAAISQFRGLDPTYVRYLISGLRDAVKQSVPFPWPQVLDICHWVIEQPREIPGRESEYADLDPGWVWTRKAIADLLASGFEPGPAEIPFKLRTSAWETLKVVAEDPDPTPEDDARFETSSRDPATVSINTTRGEAMHAVVRYALWIRRHLEQAVDGKERITRGFDEMPEVREVLDRHLDPRHDPSRAIRSVYGQWFPQLVLLDPQWVTQNVPKIFPADEGLAKLRDAAWEAYVVFCYPYDPVYDVLREEYGRAIDRLGSFPKDKHHLADPEHQLSEHLMILYWHGKLILNDEGGMLAQFYAKAPDSLRAHALAFVGRNLHNAKGSIAPEILDRLRTLWTARLDSARATTSPASDTSELTAFGWWFAAEKFDDAWAMAQLREALRLSGWAEPDHMVVKRLAVLASSMPALVVDCLGLIVEGDKRGWGIMGWRQPARTILATALRSTDETAKKSAVVLINRLGGHGYLDFQSLLNTEGSQ